MEEDSYLGNKSQSKRSRQLNTGILTENSISYFRITDTSARDLLLKSKRIKEQSLRRPKAQHRYQQGYKKNYSLPRITKNSMQQWHRKSNETHLHNNRRHQTSFEISTLHKILDKLDEKIKSIEDQNLLNKRIQEEYPELSILDELSGNNLSFRNQFNNESSIQYPYFPNQMIQPSSHFDLPMHPMRSQNYSPSCHHLEVRPNNRKLPHINSNNFQIFPKNYEMKTGNKFIRSKFDSQKINNSVITDNEVQQFKNPFNGISKIKPVNVKLKKLAPKSRNQSRKILRKFKKCVWAVLFIIILPKYSYCMKIQKYLVFKQQNQNQIIENTEKQLNIMFSRIDFGQFFLNAEKQQSKSENIQGKQIGFKIIQDNAQFFFNFYICSDFLTMVLDQITVIINSGKLQSSYPLLIHFLPGEFPFHNTLFLEQLKVLNFNRRTGALNISTAHSELLLSNYLIVKIIVDNLFFKRKQVSTMLRKKVADKDNSKKKTVITNGKKIKIALLFLNFMMKQVFDKGYSKNNSNYEKFITKFIIVPRQQQDSINKAMKMQTNPQKTTSQKNGLQNLFARFSPYLTTHRKKIKQIIKSVRKDLMRYRNQELQRIRIHVLSKSLKIQKIKFQMPAYIEPKNQNGEQQQAKN